MESKSKSERERRLEAAFIGKTIKSVDAHTINVVTLHFTDGTQASIGADDSYYGIPIVGAAKWGGDWK